MILDDFGPRFFPSNPHKRAMPKDPHVDPAKAMDFGLGFEVQLSMLKLERFTETD